MNYIEALNELKDLGFQSISTDTWPDNIDINDAIQAAAEDLLSGNEDKREYRIVRTGREYADAYIYLRDQATSAIAQGQDRLITREHVLGYKDYAEAQVIAEKLACDIEQIWDEETQTGKTIYHFDDGSSVEDCGDMVLS